MSTASQSSQCLSMFTYISVTNFLTQFYQGTAMLFLQHPHELRSRQEEEQRSHVRVR